MPGVDLGCAGKGDVQVGADRVQPRGPAHEQSHYRLKWSGRGRCFAPAKRDRTAPYRPCAGVPRPAAYGGR